MENNYFIQCPKNNDLFLIGNNFCELNSNICFKYIFFQNFCKIIIRNTEEINDIIKSIKEDISEIPSNSSLFVINKTKKKELIFNDNLLIFTISPLINNNYNDNNINLNEFQNILKKKYNIEHFLLFI